MDKHILYDTIGIFIIICGLVYIFREFYLKKAKNDKIRKYGLPAEAEIINFQTMGINCDNDWLSKGSIYFIIKFTTKAGQYIETEFYASNQLTNEKIATYRIGDKITIVYDPDDPWNVLVKDGNYSHVVILIMLGVCVALLRVTINGR